MGVRRLAAGVAMMALALSSAAYGADDPLGSSYLLMDLPVMARRAPEPVQRVPQAVTALSGELLQNARILDLNALSYYVPSLVSYGNTRDSVLYSIRGQGGFAPSGTASVTAFLNEVPASAAGPGLHYDLESVQVLRGPQGTLYGRNTTGGAILYQTRRPEPGLSANASLTLGNYSERELVAAVNLPVLSDRLLLRVALDRAVRDGFTRTLASPASSGDRDDRNYTAGRVSLAFRPVDRFENLLIFDGFRARTHETGYIPVALNANSLLPRIFPTLPSVFQQQLALGDRRQLGLDSDPFLRIDRWSLTDIADWQLGDEVRLRNIASYGRSKSLSVSDNDGLPFPILDVGLATDSPARTRQVTEEAQLHGRSLGDRLTWLAGGSYLSSPAQPFATVSRRVLGQASSSESRSAERSRALYAQATYQLDAMLPGLSLTGGYRHSWDHRFASVRSFSGGFCALAAADATCTVAKSGDFRAPAWTLGLAFQADADTLLYAAAQRGFRTGGFNLGSRDVATDFFQPEHVVNVELGLKSDWRFLGMKARTNVAAYHQNYDDVQFSGTVQQFGLANTITTNNAAATVEGVEFEGSLILLPGFEIAGTYTWELANFDRFSAPITPSNIAPYRWTNVPRHKFYLATSWTLPVDKRLGSFTLIAKWAWQDQVYIFTAPDPLGQQGVYSLVNLSADWDNMLGYPLDLQLYMTNATDSRYLQGASAGFSGLGLSTAVYADPRRYGIRLRYRFSQ